MQTSGVLDAIKSCIISGRIYWTYHVNMRLNERYIPRDVIIASIHTYEIIETYLQDKYMPSYLIYAEHEGTVFHLLAALDTEINTVRIITVYRPSREKWNADGKTRRDL